MKEMKAQVRSSVVKMINKDTKGSGEPKAVAERLRDGDSIDNEPQPQDSERTGQDK